MSKSRRVLRIVLVCLAIIGCVIGVETNHDVVGKIGDLADINTLENSIAFARLLKLIDFYNILIALFFVGFSLTILLLFDNHSARKKLLELQEKLNDIQKDSNIMTG